MEDKKQQIPPLDQNKAQKIANELLTSQNEELDDFEKESLQERAQFSQQISNIDTQLKKLDEQREALKTDRARIDGASDYVWQKLIVHRHKKNHAAGAEGAPDDSKSTKPGDQSGGATEAKAKDEAAEASTKAAEMKTPALPMPKKKTNEAQPTA